jgi:hypothetical protein
MFLVDAESNLNARTLGDTLLSRVERVSDNSGNLGAKFSSVDRGSLKNVSIGNSAPKVEKFCSFLYGEEVVIENLGVVRADGLMRADQGIARFDAIQKVESIWKLRVSDRVIDDDFHIDGWRRSRVFDNGSDVKKIFPSSPKIWSPKPRESNRTNESTLGFNQSFTRYIGRRLGCISGSCGDFFGPNQIGNLKTRDENEQGGEYRKGAGVVRNLFIGGIFWRSWGRYFVGALSLLLLYLGTVAVVTWLIRGK